MMKPSQSSDSANGARHFPPGATPQERIHGSECRAESPIHIAGLQPSTFFILAVLGRWPRLSISRAFGPRTSRNHHASSHLLRLARRTVVLTCAAALLAAL